MIKTFLNLIFYLLLYPTCKLLGKRFVSNRYKTKNSYWFKAYRKTNNIPDTKYTLW